MKKIIACIVFILLVLIGGLIHQMHEKSVQKDLYEEAAVFFKEEDYKKAIQLFEEAGGHSNLFSGSLTLNLLYYQAEAHMKLEEYDEAIAIYNQIIRESSQEEIAYIMKAYCLSESGRAEEAAEVYEEGYQKTKNKEFLYYLAEQYVTMELYEEALDLINSHRNGNEEVVKQLAFLEIVIYEKQLDYETAYEKAVAYCDRYPEDEKGIKERIFLESR